MKKYFSIQQLDRAADIYIFGDIVPLEMRPGDVSANGIVERIKQLNVDEIRVHIDSYGGSVSEGWAIYNALRQHPAKVTTFGDGFVASAALYPFLAGDERIASNLSAYYFHRVSIATEGYADELRKAADEAEQMTEIGISAFVERAGMEESAVRELMEAETWLTPAQALDYGKATNPPFVGFGCVRRTMMNGVTEYWPLILPKIKFGLPSEEMATQEDQIDWQTQELTATVMRDDTAAANWKVISAEGMETEEEAVQAINAFFGEVEGA